jgi:hypothetical protein
MEIASLTEILQKHTKWLTNDAGGEKADLRGADLRGADLRGADLRGADLCGANLCWAISGAVCRMDFGGWSICIREDRSSIGCQTHDNSLWLSWTPDSPEIASMHHDAPQWWAVYGPAIRASIRVVIAAAGREE